MPGDVAASQGVGPSVSYLCRCDADMVSARRPGRIRALALLVVTAYAASWFWPDVFFIGALHTRLALTVGAVWCGLLSGPREVQIDLRRRTYSYRGNWQHLFRVATGPLSDVAAVGVQNFPHGACPHRYELSLIWNVPGRPETFLAQYGARQTRKRSGRF